MTEPQVLDAAESSRFEIHVDGRLAGFAVYRLGHGRISFIHTEIDQRFEGQGLGSELIAAVLDAARDAGTSVLPFCPFVNGYIARHPAYVELVPSKFRAEFGL